MFSACRKVYPESSPGTAFESFARTLTMKTSRFLPASIVLAVLAPAAAQAQYITAGTLYVDLRATNMTAGTTNWVNEAAGFGAGAHFTNFGVPTLVTNVNNTAIPGVFFGGAA